MSCSFWDNARAAPPPAAAAAMVSGKRVLWGGESKGGAASAVSGSGGAKRENGRRGVLLCAAPQNPRKLMHRHWAVMNMGWSVSRSKIVEFSIFLISDEFHRVIAQVLTSDGRR